jgi:hypothetical protein
MSSDAAREAEFAWITDSEISRSPAKDPAIVKPSWLVRLREKG